MTPGTFVTYLQGINGKRLWTGWAPRNDRWTLSGSDARVGGLMLIITIVRKNPFDGAFIRHTNAYPIVYVLTPECTGWFAVGAGVHLVDETD